MITKNKSILFSLFIALQVCLSGMNINASVPTPAAPTPALISVENSNVFKELFNGVVWSLNIAANGLVDAAGIFMELSPRNKLICLAAAYGLYRVIKHTEKFSVDMTWKVNWIESLKVWSS